MHLFQVAPNTGSQVSGFFIVNIRKKLVSYIFYFLYLLTVHLGTILVNNQLNTLSLMYLFILPLYMFRTAQCSSSGDQLY
jgi:hypothetical protein